MLLDVGFAVPYAGCALELGLVLSLVVMLLVGKRSAEFQSVGSRSPPSRVEHRWLDEGTL